MKHNEKNLRRTNASDSEWIGEKTTSTRKFPTKGVVLAMSGALCMVVITLAYCVNMTTGKTGKVEHFHISPMTGSSVQAFDADSDLEHMIGKTILVTGQFSLVHRDLLVTAAIDRSIQYLVVGVVRSILDQREYVAVFAKGKNLDSQDTIKEDFTLLGDDQKYFEIKKFQLNQLPMKLEDKGREKVLEDRNAEEDLSFIQLEKLVKVANVNQEKLNDLVFLQQVSLRR